MGQLPEDLGRLPVASLNTRGAPVFASRLAERYRAIGEFLEASDVEVVNFQEVHSYYHLRQLTKHLPSFRHVVHGRSAVGPAGGLVTMSRRRAVGKDYKRFPLPPARLTARLPRRSRFMAPLKGILMTRLEDPEVWIINTHLLANFDGDWSEENRYYPLHRHQLATLARVLDSVAGPLIVSGDFNIARDSRLFSGFTAESRLVDAFDGDCPPTFHAAYLEPGQPSHCIDFLLLSDPSITLEAAELTFTDKLLMPGGAAYASDHLGLLARVAI